VGSTDKSINVSNVNQGNIFDDLRTAITGSIHSKDDSRILLEIVDSMEETKGTPLFIDKYKSFMETAANHMTVVSVHSALSQLLDEFNNDT
jgi:hypothetical protein